MVTGGGALIQGIDRMLSEKLQVPVMVAENPLQSVAIGTGILLNRIKADRGIFSGIRRLFMVGMGFVITRINRIYSLDCLWCTCY